MTTNKITPEEQLDAAWQARVHAQDRLGKALEDLEQEVTHQRKLWLGRWGTDLDAVATLAEQAHTAQAELTGINKQIAALQDLLRTR